MAFLGKNIALDNLQRQFQAKKKQLIKEPSRIPFMP